MSLIPEMKLKDFQKLSKEEVKKLDSVILNDSEGNYMATLIIPQTDFIKMQAEYMGELSNCVRPKGA